MSLSDEVLVMNVCNEREYLFLNCSKLYSFPDYIQLNPRLFTFLSFIQIT